MVNDAAQLRKIARKNGASVRSFLEKIEREAKHGNYFVAFSSHYDFEQEDIDDICLDLTLKGFYVKAYKNIYFVIHVKWENARILGKGRNNMAARMKAMADLANSAFAALEEELVKAANKGQTSLRICRVSGHDFGYGLNDINPYAIIRAFEEKGFKVNWSTGLIDIMEISWG